MQDRAEPRLESAAQPADPVPAPQARKQVRAGLWRGLGQVLALAAPRADVSKMPERVQARIARQDDNAEILVRLFQLAIVILFGTLYFFAPKTDAATDFQLAPIAITFYFVATLGGLAWSLSRPLPDWVIYLSILIDITILYVMIWSFHLQYDQPPSFYLKAPTLLYVFIFIALRALRFRARFVVAAGLTAALGWIVLFVYAIVIDPADTMVTRDYVSYLTGNFVLVGAEIDKIVSILAVTAILALVIRRARALLVQAVSEEIAADDLSRFFDASVARRIRGSEQLVSPGEGVPRQAAILFVDIRGFSALASSIDPNQAIRLLAAYGRKLVPIIQANGGTIDKFLGDGIMATFEAVTETKSYAASALRAIDAVMAETRRWHGDVKEGDGTTGDTAKDDAGDTEMSGLEVNAAVATGAVIFGALGDARRLEYTVIGAPVNLAAKLEKHNKVVGSRAIASAEAYRIAREQGYRPRKEPTHMTSQVEGIAEAVEIAVLFS